MAGAIAGLGGLDVLVDNAGFPMAAPSDRLDIADFDRVLAVNLRRAAIRHFLTRPFGR